MIETTKFEESNSPFCVLTWTQIRKAKTIAKLHNFKLDSLGLTVSWKYVPVHVPHLN